MYFLYELAIRLYCSAIRLAACYHPKAKRWVNGRKSNWAVYESIPFEKGKWAWFHCCSFGEYQDGRSILEAFRAAYPDYRILLTFNSPSGYELLSQTPLADAVCYLPPDTASNSKRFVKLVNPAIVFIIRNDIWPNYMRRLGERKIPAFLVSFTLAPQSRFLNAALKPLYRKAFNSFHTVFVQDAVSQSLLQKNRYGQNVVQAGNTRADRVMNIFLQPEQIPQLENFSSGYFTVIAGSTLSRDLEMILQVIREKETTDIRWIIVPHEVDRAEINRAKKIFGKKMICLSEYERLAGEEHLLWIDSVGLLAKAYRYASIAFIGGGFEKIGIHNILEPAVFGCPVCFGPNHRNLPEAIDLLQNGGAQVVRNQAELRAFIDTYHSQNDLLKKISERNRNYLRSISGATEIILTEVKKRTGD